MSLIIDAELRSIRNVLAKFGQGAFYAHTILSSPQAIATGATPTAITVGTEDIDICSWFANSVFTPKQPGYYILYGKLHVIEAANFTNDTTYIELFIRKNGTTPAIRAFSYTKYQPVSDVVIVEANGTTDYFDLAARTNSAGTVTISDVAFGGVFVSYNNP